ncbi:hypothetical protein BJX65DRAFT_290974 [Aspergillus insuetus]
MHAKGSLSSALLLFLSVTSVHAGSASISLYKDARCSNSQIISEIQPAIDGHAGGCTPPWTVQGFKSARLNWSTGLSAVAICPQGYNCDTSSINLIPSTGICIASYGTFDKVRLCDN